MVRRRTEVPVQPQVWDEPIFGELGVLRTDGDRAECHICAGWYRLLGSHVFQAHGLYAYTYRRLFGLRQRTGLAAERPDTEAEPPSVRPAEAPTVEPLPATEHAEPSVPGMVNEPQASPVRGWQHVRRADGVAGWIAADLLASVGDEVWVVHTDGPVALIRVAPSRDLAAIGVVADGALLTTAEAVPTQAQETRSTP
jgi:hypothetical protein